MDFKLEQASLSGGFRVDVRLASKKDGETIQAAVGHARNKQAGKQVAAAALLEALLAGGEVDEGALLAPAAGKEEGRKKKWQVAQPRAVWLFVVGSRRGRWLPLTQPRAACLFRRCCI